LDQPSFSFNVIIIPAKHDTSPFILKVNPNYLDISASSQ
jgi:hypothetical protein